MLVLLHTCCCLNCMDAAQKHAKHIKTITRCIFFVCRRNLLNTKSACNVPTPRKKNEQQLTSEIYNFANMWMKTRDFTFSKLDPSKVENPICISVAHFVHACSQQFWCRIIGFNFCMLRNQSRCNLILEQRLHNDLLHQNKKQRNYHE